MSSFRSKKYWFSTMSLLGSRERRFLSHCQISTESLSNFALNSIALVSRNCSCFAKFEYLAAQIRLGKNGIKYNRITGLQTIFFFFNFWLKILGACNAIIQIYPKLTAILTNSLIINWLKMQILQYYYRYCSFILGSLGSRLKFEGSITRATEFYKTIIW